MSFFQSLDSIIPVYVKMFNNSESRIFSWVDPAGGGEGTGCPDPPTPGNHVAKLLYFSLEILVWTPLEKQLDPWVQLLHEVGSNCFTRLGPIASRGGSICIWPSSCKILC